MKITKKIIEIVKKAGLLTKGKFVIKEKAGSSNIVTSADLKISAFLKKNLKKLISDSSYFDEELKKEKDKDYEWIVDPIDGTTNFSRSIKHFAISVALKHKEKIVLGVVYLPFTEELFYADETGAYYNNKKIKVSNRKFKESIICTAMSLYDKSKAKICSDIIYDVYMKINDFRRFGSCAVELCYLALGLCDLYFEIRVFPWDFAAAAFILEKAGGFVSSINGKPLSYDKKPIILIGANSKENFRKLNKIISNHIKEK